MDYRELGGERFDAIASIGMVEHVGAVQDRRLRRAPSPACSSRAGGCSTTASRGCATATPRRGAFSERYVFPDAAPLHLSRILLALERAGFVTQHVEGFASDYAETLRHWAQRLDDNLDEAMRLAGPERVRVWRLYLRAARNGFETGFTSIYQARCRSARSVTAPARSGPSRPPTVAYEGKPDSTVSSAQSAPDSAQLLDRVAAGRHPDDLDPGAVAGLDVARGVADGE